MARRRTVEDLTVEELRQLLIEKRRKERRSKLEHYRQTGRVIQVEAQPAPVRMESMRSSPLPSAAETPLPARRVWMDRILLLVEIAAVLGLVLVLLNGMNIITNLNREVSSALVQPTLTPTAVISAVVLPSGHTSPDSSSVVQPNDAEIPDHLRPLVQNLANLPIPTPSPSHAIRIQIPAINVDAPIVQGDAWEQLKKGVGQHIGTPNPGEAGNLVLAAHNDIFGEIFRDLDKLKNGDQIILYTSQKSYTYVVQASQIVDPTAVEVMNQTADATATLISCYPYRVDNKRIVISAKLLEQR